MFDESKSQTCQDPAPIAGALPCGHCALDPVCRGEDGTLWPVRWRLAAGEALYCAGDRLEALYAVHAGAFKLRLVQEPATPPAPVPPGGRAKPPAETVLGFHTEGDMVGADGLGTGRHTHDAIALVDSIACVVPYEPLYRKTLATERRRIEFHRILGRQQARDHRMIALLGGQSAEARVALMLQDLLDRQVACGGPADRIDLPMSRRDMARYLGLALETVSRCFTRMIDAGVMAVDQRFVEILDPAALVRMASQE